MPALRQVGIEPMTPAAMIEFETFEDGPVAGAMAS
jgi:hypothetical protein